MIYANYTVAPTMASEVPADVAAIALTSITERRGKAIIDGPLLRWGIYEVKLMSDLMEVWPQIGQSDITFQRNRPKLPDKYQVAQLEMVPSEVYEVLVAPLVGNEVESLQRSPSPMVSLPALDRTHTAAVVVSLLNSVQDYCVRLALRGEKDSYEECLSSACKYAACLQVLFQLQIDPWIVDDWGRGFRNDGARMPFEVPEDDLRRLCIDFPGTAFQLYPMLVADCERDYAELIYDMWRADDALCDVTSALPSSMYPIRWMCPIGNLEPGSEKLRNDLLRSLKPFGCERATSFARPDKTLWLTPRAARGLAVALGLSLQWWSEAEHRGAESKIQMGKEPAYVKRMAALHAGLLDIVGSDGNVYA